MKKKAGLAISLLLFAVIVSSQAATKPSSVLLQEALYAEEVEGNINSAVKIYQQIIADDSAQRPHKAQALYRLGSCYLKLKDEQQAKGTFQTLLAQYSDQTQIIEKVKPLLDEISNADPAMLMPPETLVYIELGSPGKQIETILNMLKGTPFENPLAAMSGGQGTAQNQQAVGTPQGIIGALLNPSMMAEFKKIRGMGVGITGVSQNNPPVLVVLYPGKSDALRGLILAGLGMFGKPVDSIEGLQTLKLGDMGFAAYDDTVVIISANKDAAGQLTRVVKQYKGTASSPSLASNNKFFARINKNDRQRNLLTLWANVDEIYGQLLKQFPDGKIPREMLAAQGILDFANIDDLVSFVSLEEQNITLETDVTFKDGHHCLAYDLIRTPNLSKAGFEAVPSEAVGLVSFALASPDSAQAKAASEKIQHVTGLDIGREIFANIEQVTLFAVQGAKSDQAVSKIHPLLNHIGLALTSRNPQQTRDLLTTLLGVANMVSGGKQPVAGESGGKYQIGMVNNQQLYCYLDQASKATVLTLNPDIVEEAVNAVKTHKSVLQAGLLKESIGSLPSSTSKLVLVNVGGAIQIAATAMMPSSGEGNDKLQQTVAQLVKACERTTVQLRSDEEINSLSHRISISGLPPANQIAGPIMQMYQLMNEGKRQARAERRKSTVTADIVKAGQAPVIDGQVEDLWSNARKYDIKNIMYSPVSGPDDCTAAYKAMWDADNLYLLVEVKDDSLKNNGGDFWNNDGIEVFIDADNCKSESYGEKDFQFHFVWDKNKPTMGEEKHQAAQGVQFAMVTTQTGYCTEIKLPWSTLKAKPSAGTTIGFDIHINDDDDGGDRDTKLAWCGKEDDAWENPQALGNAQLLGLVGWWKFDESDGTTAADSSGNGINGTLQGGPKWLPSGGKLGGALEFDGVDDFVETNYTTDLPIWTVAVWVNSSVAPSSENQSGPVHREKNYQINWNHQTDAFRGAAGVKIGDTWYDASFGPLQANTWYHLVATYNGKDLKAYKDGAFISKNSDPSGPPEPETATLKFGKHAAGPDYFAGKIDDVRIYNYALSDTDVAALYAGR